MKTFPLFALTASLFIGLTARSAAQHQSPEPAKPKEAEVSRAREVVNAQQVRSGVPTKATPIPRMPDSQPIPAAFAADESMLKSAELQVSLLQSNLTLTRENVRLRICASLGLDLAPQSCQVDWKARTIVGKPAEAPKGN